MNIDELVYDLKEHLDTYCQTYDDYDMTYNQTEMIYYLIKDLEKENQKYKEVINKLKQFCNNDDNFWILDAYSQDGVYEIQEKLLDMLNEVEDK